MKNIIVVMTIVVSTISIFHGKPETQRVREGKVRILLDRKRLEARLEREEGKRLIVYRDSRGYPTVGIGHHVTKKDRFHVGDAITEERCRQIFKQDVDAAINFCEKQFKSIYAYQPFTVQEVLVTMCFNLGPVGLSKFQHFLEALAEKDYPAAAEELQRSSWYDQVKSRAERIKTALQNEIPPPKPEIAMTEES